MLHIVAAFTIFLNRKGGVAIVASTAGFTFAHLIHRETCALFVIGDKYPGVAVAAAVHLGVNTVWECGIAIFNLESNIAGRVAGTAVFVNREGLTTIVTGAARLALAHVIHAGLRILVSNNVEYAVVAQGALFAQRIEVIVVAEFDRAGRLNVHFDDIIYPAGSG